LVRKFIVARILDESLVESRRQFLDVRWRDVMKEGLNVSVGEDGESHGA
jgi:hypothetical protein